MEIIYTLHAKDKMKKRRITEDEVIHVIKNPDKTLKIKGKYYAQKNIGRAKIEVVYEKDKYKGSHFVLHMKITFDKEADAVYIEFSSGEFASNKKIDNDTIIDLDKDGNILGIELLNVGKRIPKNFLSSVQVENLVS